MAESGRVRVAINGYGVIGKRVADAIARQPDLEVAGVSDVISDWRIQIARERGFPVFAATDAAAAEMAEAGLSPAGSLGDLLAGSDVVVDCTPRRIATANAATYAASGIRYVLQGGEGHEITGHSFVAEASYASAVGRTATRVVSCNTTSIVRTLTALKSGGLLASARGTLLRRATDPWESHLGGIMNTLVPEPAIPSHQGPDARSVDPGLDVVTMAVRVPQTLGHLHFWAVRLARASSREEVLSAFRRSRRIALISSDALPAINSVKEWMLDLGRPRGDLYEVALWKDLVTVNGDELFYAYMVDNQAIVIPETVDAVRALCGLAADAETSMKITDETMAIGALTQMNPVRPERTSDATP